MKTFETYLHESLELRRTAWDVVHMHQLADVPPKDVARMDFENPQI